jgi:hypothetical protein
MRARLRRSVSATLISLLLLQTQGAVGWDNEGHVYVNRVAAQKIPSDMPSFFRHAVMPRYGIVGYIAKGREVG